MSIDPVALVRRLHAAFNAYDRAEITPMFAPDAVYISRGINGRVTGRDAIISAFDAYFAEFPDQVGETLLVEQLSPNKVRAAWRLEATAKSSGQRVTRQGLETVTFDDEGRVTEVLVEDQ